MTRTMDQKHQVTTSTARPHEHEYNGRNNESKADLPSVFLVLSTADMVVQGREKL